MNKKQVANPWMAGHEADEAVAAKLDALCDETQAFLRVICANDGQLAMTVLVSLYCQGVLFMAQGSPERVHEMMDGAKEIALAHQRRMAQ